MSIVDWFLVIGIIVALLIGIYIIFFVKIRTYKSVAKELVDGLKDGSIVLDKERKIVPKEKHYYSTLYKDKKVE